MAWASMCIKSAVASEFKKSLKKFYFENGASLQHTTIHTLQYFIFIILLYLYFIQKNISNIVRRIIFNWGLIYNSNHNI